MTGRHTSAALVVRSVVSIMCAVLLVCLTAGCSGHSGDAGDAALPPTSDPVTWAGRLCSSLQPLAALKDDVPDFNRNNPAESRQAMSQYFQRAASAAEASLQGLAQAGPSPIQGGDQVATTLRGALQQLRTAFTDAKTKVDAVDPNDPVGMGTQLPGILTELANATDNANLDSIGTDPQLDDAIKKAPSCSLVGAADSGQGGN
jgi:hypothetical protein